MALRLCKLKSATPNWKREFRDRFNLLALAVRRRFYCGCLRPGKSRIAGYLSREAIRSKLRLGLDQLQRGEGIPEDQLNSHLAKLLAKLE